MMFATTYCPPAFTTAYMPVPFTPAMMASFRTPHSTYTGTSYRGAGGSSEPEEPNFRPPYWAFAAAGLLLAASGCKYLKKKKSKGELEGVGEQKDARVKRNIPKKAFMIGKSYRIETPKSGGIPTTKMHKMKLSARKDALRNVRNYFKKKKPVRCLSEIKIEFRSELEEYRLHVGKQGKWSYNYYTYRLPWTQASCIGKGKMAGAAGKHLFMVENPHRNLFDQ